MTPMPLLLIPLAALLGMGFVWLLFTAARRGEPRRDGDTLTFRHGWVLRAFAPAALFGGEAFFAIWMLLYPPQSPRTGLTIIAGASVLAVVGTILFWEAIRFQLVLRPGELDCRSPWRARQVVPWELVKRVSFSSANLWFVFHCETGTFCVSATVPGVRYLLEACERHLKPEQLAEAKPGYAWAGRKPSF